MHRLPTRCVNDIWEVLVPVSTGDRWIACNSEHEAYEMSLSGNLAFDAVEGKRRGDEVAQELEAAARLFLRYDCVERATWLAEYAKVARGEPSIFYSPGTTPPTNT
jgi:hypothetical protein